MDNSRYAIGRYTGMIEGRHGPMMFNRKDRFIGASLATYGEYSYAEQELFQLLVKPGDVVIEAGAHIGTHTVGLSRLCKTLYAFEPQRLCYQQLCGNLALAECQNVHARQEAVGMYYGTITVPIPDPAAENSNTGGVILPGVMEGEQVQLVPLDASGIVRCDFIKADVEEMEWDVVVGAKKLIEHCFPILYLESNHSHRRLVDLVVSMGYTPYWHVPPFFNPYNYFEHQQDIFGGIVSTNMLCLPEPRQIPNTYKVYLDDPGLDQKKGEPFKVMFEKETA